MHEHLIKILFKSGNSIEMWFETFDVVYNGNDIISFKWVNSDKTKFPLCIDVRNVEAIFQLERREIKDAYE